MRKKRGNSRLAPFVRGIATGYMVTAAISAAGALILLLFGADGGISWLPATAAAAAGSFVCGRTAGKIRRHDGLRTGAICGVMYIAPLIHLAIILGRTDGTLILIMLLLCLGFAAGGAVSGVNSPES